MHLYENTGHLQKLRQISCTHVSLTSTSTCAAAGLLKGYPRFFNFIPHEGQGDPYMLVEEEDTCINQEMTQSLRRAEGRTRRHPFWQSCLLHFLLVVVMQGGGLLGAQEMHNYSLPTAYGGPRASEYSPWHARRRVAYNTVQRNLSIKDTLN